MSAFAVLLLAFALAAPTFASFDAFPNSTGSADESNLATRVAPHSHTDVSPTASGSAPPLTPVVVVTPPAVLSFIPAGAARAPISQRATSSPCSPETRRVERSQTRSAPPAISAFPIPVPRGAPRRPRRRSAREVLCGIHSSSAGSRHPSAFATRARRAASATDRSRASARGASTASSRRRHPGTNVPVPAPGTNVPVPVPALVPASRGGVRRASRRLLVCGEARRRGPVRVLRIRRRRVDVLLRRRVRRIRRLLRRRRGMLRGSAIVGDAKGRGRTRVDRT